MMATFRSPLTLRSLSAPLRRAAIQRRWARVVDVRFLATHPQPDRIYEKYREKLSQKAKEEGHRDVRALMEAYKDKIESVRHEPLRAPSSELRRETSSTLSTSPRTPIVPHTSRIKTLSSYIDIQKIMELPPEQISEIWRLRFASNPESLVATIPSLTYASIHQTASKHPRFVLPIPRSNLEEADAGAELHYLEWTFPSPTTSTVLFTQLAEFKLRGEYAQPHTTITHHLDLSSPKGIVLMEGQVTKDHGVSVEDGKWLVMCLQKFYNYSMVEDDGSKQKRMELLEQFSGGHGSFSVEDLLNEVERI